MPYEPEWLDAGHHPLTILLPTASDIVWTEPQFRGGFGRGNHEDGTEVEPEWLRLARSMLNFTAVWGGEHLYWISTLLTGHEKAQFWIARDDLSGALESEWLYLGEDRIGTYRGIAADDTYLYIYHRYGPILPESTGTWYIGRLHLGTKAWEPEWLATKEEWKGGGFTERPPGYTMAVGAGYIFWSVPGGIARARLSDGGGIDENWTQRAASKALNGVSPAGSVTSLWVGGEWVWAGCAGLLPHIYRVSLDGKVLEVITLPQVKALTQYHVAADEVYLYWDASGNFIGRWPLDEIPGEEIPISEKEKEEKEKVEEEEKGGGTGKEKEEEEERAKKQKEKEEEEQKDKEKKEQEEQEKIEREEKVKKEEQEEKERIEGEAGGGVVPPPEVDATDVALTPGVVRFGRLTT